jgi:hypothetical protein
VSGRKLIGKIDVNRQQTMVRNKDGSGAAADALTKQQARRPLPILYLIHPYVVQADPISVIDEDKRYLQTIDETAIQMQTNPLRETAQLFQQQFAAVQEMRLRLYRNRFNSINNSTSTQRSTAHNWKTS